MADVLHTSGDVADLFSATVSRRLRAPRTRVFDAWTRPDEIKRWWGPTGFTTHTAKVDLRPGGAFRFVMRGPDGADHLLEGVYVEIDPPARLVFEVHRHCDGSPDAFDADTMTITEVTVEFRAVEGGATELVLTHRGFADAAAAAEHEWGWGGALGDLAAVLEGAGI